MQLALRDNLLFATVTLAYQGKQINISNVLIDTGSSRTIFAADMLSTIHLTPAVDDTLYIIRGVGGTEVVFSRQVDYVQLGECQVIGFEIEIGGMDYGFDIQGILGLDFLQQAKAILNLATLEISFA